MSIDLANRVTCNSLVSGHEKEKKVGELDKSRVSRHFRCFYTVFSSTRLLPPLQPNPYRLLHSLSPEPQDLHGPQRTRPKRPVSMVNTYHGRNAHLFHSFTDIPVHKGTLRVHEIEFVICKSLMRRVVTLQVMDAPRRPHAAEMAVVL
jgi:hypothetical protein